MFDDKKYPIRHSIFRVAAGLFIGSILGEGILLCIDVVPSHRDFGSTFIYLAVALLTAISTLYGEK